jgi:hypothetical protein
MKILAIGDSFTAGAELIDEFEVPKHPGYFSEPPRTDSENSSINAWERKPRYPWIRANYKTSELFKIMTDKEKARSYPNLIANKLDCEVTNLALSGASMYNLTRMLLDKILFEKDFSDTIIFYQPTGMDRICQYMQNDWKDFILPNLENYNWAGKDFMNWLKQTISYENDYSLIMAWFKEFYTALNLIKTTNCKQFYLVDTGFKSKLDNALRSIYDNIQKNEVMKYRIHLEHSTVNKWLNLGSSAQQLAKTGYTETHCPMGHFSPRVHEHFAETIVNKLKTENII